MLWVDVFVAVVTVLITVDYCSYLSANMKRLFQIDPLGRLFSPFR